MTAKMAASTLVARSVTYSISTSRPGPSRERLFPFTTLVELGVASDLAGDMTVSCAGQRHSSLEDQDVQ